MVDYLEIKENIKKILDADLPDSEVDRYLKDQGLEPEQVIRNIKIAEGKDITEIGIPKKSTKIEEAKPIKPFEKFVKEKGKWKLKKPGSLERFGGGFARGFAPFIPEEGFTIPSGGFAGGVGELAGTGTAIAGLSKFIPGAGATGRVAKVARAGATGGALETLGQIPRSVPFSEKAKEVAKSGAIWAGLQAIAPPAIGMVKKAMEGRRASKATKILGEIVQTTGRIEEQQGASQIANLKNINLSKFPKYIRGTLAEVASKAGLKTRPVVNNKAIVKMASDLAKNSENLPLLERIAKTQRGRLGAELTVARNQLADDIFNLADDVLLSPSSMGKAKVVSRGAEEVGRTLGTLKMPVAKQQAVFDALQKRMLKATPEEKVQLLELQKAVLGKYAPPGMLEKAIEWATASKLTSPWTHMRNIIGNTYASLMRPIEKVTAGTINLFEEAVTGKPQTRFVREGVADAVGMWSGIKTGGKNALKSLTDESFASSRYGKTIELQQQPAIKGVFGKIVRVPFRLLSAMDEFFRPIRHSAESYSLAEREALTKGLSGLEKANFVQHRAKRFLQSVTASYKTARTPGGEVMQIEGLKPWEQIRKLASESLYQSELDKYWLKIDAVRGIPGIKFIVPFFRTPVNIAKYQVQRSPLGIFSKRNWKDLLASSGTRAEALARITIGSALSATTWALASENYITGAGPKSKAERDVLYATGWQPYSFRIPMGDKNVYVSYRGFEPISLYLSTLADTVEKTREKGEAPSAEEYVDIAFQAARNLRDQPFLYGLNGFMDALETSKGAIRFINQFASGQLVPTGLRFAQKVGSPKIKERRTIIEELMSGIPGLANKLPDRVNVLGEEVRFEENTLLRSLNVSTEREYRVAEELARLSVTPSLPSKTVIIGNKKAKLTDEEYNDFLIERGVIIKDVLSTIVDGNKYRDANDEQRKAMLEKSLYKISIKYAPQRKKVITREPERLKSKRPPISPYIRTP